MNEILATIKGKKRVIKFIDENKVSVDGEIKDYAIQSLNGSGYILKIGTEFYEMYTQKKSDESYLIYYRSDATEVTIRTALQEKALEMLSTRNSKNHHTVIKAPMPGMIVKINKQPGEEVVQGESVMILEAMKMENDLRSPIQGRIKSISAKEGNAVEKGTVLFVIE